MNLIKNPIWKKSQLGYAIPESDHAVSVALPTWDDVIAYEEKDPYCLNSLKSIYPRFGLNPLVKKLANKFLFECKLNDHNAWPYPNYYFASKAKSYCDGNCDNKSSFIIEKKDITFLITTGYANKYARIFWQHSGLGTSSRAAAVNLELELGPSKNLVRSSLSKIKERLSKYSGAKSEFIHITSSGMSALHTALEIIYTIAPHKPTLQIGFPYVDVLKLPKNIFYGANLLIENSTQDIENEIIKINPSAIIIELPSNPMLKCANLKRISQIAHKFNIPIISDDTIGSNININSLEHSDLVFTSLTKIFSGTGDILAGSLILNPKSKWIKDFKKALTTIEVPKLYDSDIILLEKASRDVKERVLKQNENCLLLKEKLKKHKAIRNVFHPESCPNFNSILKKEGGYGCLLSFELKGKIEKVKQFYDSIKITKGPSLGTQFTLVCPYVQLAHYEELSWAESLGVPPLLIRVSVGLEENENLWNIFSQALDSL